MSVEQDVIKIITDRILASTEATDILNDDAHEGNVGHGQADSRFTKAVGKMAKAIVEAVGEKDALDLSKSMDMAQLVAGIEKTMHNKKPEIKGRTAA